MRTSWTASSTDRAAAAATARLTSLGISVRVGARTEEAVISDGRVTGVRLEGGEVLGADLLVLTAGTVPEVGLAQRAGLDVARGIVVGTDLASPADARVFAIGDCAEPPEGGSGLIAQGWDQARRLATLLTEPSAARDDVPLPTVGTDVVKVKGVGLDVVAMGVCGPLTGGRRVRLSDPEGGRHIEVVVADGRVIGATCVGAGPVAADLVAAYTRGTPAPTDPAQLLVRPVAGTAVPAASPTMMPDRAVVCRCNGVTKGDIGRLLAARRPDGRRRGRVDPRDHRVRRLQGRRLRHRRLAPPLRPGPAGPVESIGGLSPRPGACHRTLTFDPTLVTRPRRSSARGQVTMTRTAS